MTRNVVKEFRKEEVVTNETEKIKSALRGKPCTPGRLVKLDVIEEQMDMTNDTDQNNVQEICGSESDRLET